VQWQGREWGDIQRNAFHSCENIVALASELGIQRTLLYKWRKKFEADEAIGDPVPVNAREGKLRKELGYVKRLLGREGDGAGFFQRRDLFCDKAQRNGARRNARRVRVRESRFMRQPRTAVENEVGFLQL
jgi:hypothetical protein